jgi:hypothetical protein
VTDMESDSYGDAPGPANQEIGANRPPATYDEELRLENRDLFLRYEALEAERAKLPAMIADDAALAEVGKFVVRARALAKDVDDRHKKISAPHKEKANTCDVVFLSRGLKGRVEASKGLAEAVADVYTAAKEAARRAELAREAERIRLEAEATAYEAKSLDEGGMHAVADMLESQAEHQDKAADKLEAKAAGSTADLVRARLDGVTAGGRTIWTADIEDAAKIDLNLLRAHILGHELKQMVDRFVSAGGRELAGVNIYPKAVSTFR